MHEASAAYISRILYIVRYCSALRSKPHFAVCVCVCVCVSRILFIQIGCRVTKKFLHVQVFGHKKAQVL